MAENVLVTGVAGFIGSNLLDLLIEKTDWTIIGCDNLSTGNVNNIVHHLKNERFEFLNQNCSDIKSLKPFTKVFHLAALPRIQPSFVLINEHITANLLESTYLIELMIKENHYPKFIYSGSSAIYGTPLNYPTTELERIDCLSPYAFQKYEVEKYLCFISLRFPLDYVVLRYFNPFGNRSFNPENKFNAYSSVVGIFLNQLKNQQNLTITGDGSQKRDFIHVLDVAEANLLVSKSEIKINDSFNVGSGEYISILELAKLISKEITFLAKREGEADTTWASIEKIKTEFNWSPKLNVKDYIISELNRL